MSKEKMKNNETYFLVGGMFSVLFIFSLSPSFSPILSIRTLKQAWHNFDILISLVSTHTGVGYILFHIFLYVFIIS